MTSVGPNWEPHSVTVVGKGAIAQQFTANARGKKLKIEIAP